MKAFNLEEYLADPSKKIITRDGRKVRIVCTDMQCANGLDAHYPIGALVNNDGTEFFYSYTINGEFVNGQNNIADLFFATVKKEGWINIYKSIFNNILPSLTVYETKEDAVKSIYSQDCYIDTIKIEWEE